MLDSGVSRLRRYSPGRSTTSIVVCASPFSEPPLLPLPIVARPMRAEVVVPGKFEVLARVPQRRLKTVVLPVLGLPIRATRGRRSRPPICEGTARAVGATGAGGGDADGVADVVRSRSSAAGSMAAMRDVRVPDDIVGLGGRLGNHENTAG